MEITQRDPGQIDRYEHEESINARRVVLVGGGQINMEANLAPVIDKLEELKLNYSQPANTPISQVQIIEKPVIIEKEIIRTVEIPQIIEKEITKTVEIPVIVEKDKIVYIDRPVIQEVTKYIEIEKPIIIEKEKFLKVPNWVYVCFGLQTIALFGLMIIKLVK